MELELDNGSTINNDGILTIHTENEAFDIFASPDDITIDGFSFKSLRDFYIKSQN